MQVNTDIWGASSTWLTDIFFWSTNSAYTDNNLAWYNAADRQIQSISAFSINNPIDYTICYAAHAAAEKMPLADIAVYDYLGQKACEQTENCGFFFCDIPELSTLRSWVWGWDALKNGITSVIDSTSIYRWLPEARLTYNSTENVNRRLRPVVQFGIKSFFCDLRVVLVSNDYRTAQFMWLKDLEDNLATYAENYHIESAVLRMFTYSGRTGTNFRPFSRNNNTKYSNVGNGALAIDKNLHIIGSDITMNNYCMSLDNGILPVFGTVNQVSNVDNTGYYGTRVYSNAGGAYNTVEQAEPVYMSSLVDEVVITQYTESHGFPAYRMNLICPITAENCEKIRKGAAAYGFFFTDTDPSTNLLTDATNENRWIHEDMLCGILDDDGIGHGEYTRGLRNVTNPVFDYENSQDSKYNPNKNVDPNTYSNVTGFNSISGGASMTKRYVLDKANVDKLADDLWTISSELATVQGVSDYEYFDAKVIDNFLVTSPIDSIVSIKRYPFSVPHTFSNTKELVKLGKNTATAQGYATYNVFNTVQFSGVNIFPRFGGCFLDYEPYTSYEVYVPFCGTTNLQAADILGHTLNIRLQIDLLTGTCTAYIMADSLCIETLTGNCGCDLQITGTDTTYMNSAIVNSITNARNAKTQKEVADMSTISPGGLLSAISNPWKAAGEKTTAETNRYQADYNLQHIQAPLHSMGTASALTGWYQEFNARLMIYYPEGDAIVSSVPPTLANLSNYGHTTGFATVENKTLSNFTGLTVCSDVDLSGISQATATEKQMIYNALTGGVYI